MRALVGVVVGGLLAFAIACGGGSKSAVMQRPEGPPPMPPGGAGGQRTELERLDALITADMDLLKEPRPAAPVGACVENCADQMGGAAAAATKADPTCKPAQTETCNQSCTLKESICTNAGKICSIASDLGGKDQFANETCNRGSASCDAAKKRCCSCM